MQIYDVIYGIWFEQLPNKSKFYSSFIDGGYYSYEVSPELKIIAVNSLYFTEATPSKTAVKQMNWLKLELEESSTNEYKQSIVLMNILPGLRNTTSDKWNKVLTE